MSKNEGFIGTIQYMIKNKKEGSLLAGRFCLKIVLKIFAFLIYLHATKLLCFRAIWELLLRKEISSVNLQT